MLDPGLGHVVSCTRMACTIKENVLPLNWQCPAYKAATAMAIIPRKPKPAPMREALPVAMAGIDVVVVAGKPAEGEVVKVVTAGPVG